MDEKLLAKIIGLLTPDERQDVLEIGTPGSGGAIKVRGDASNSKDFEARIDNMIALRAYAQTRMKFTGPVKKGGEEPG